MNVVPADEIGIQNAVAVLTQGGVVVFPTETAYGIGCDATNTEAVDKVFEIKGRPDEKGTPLIISSLKMAEPYVEILPELASLAETHWPGALNIIFSVNAESELAPRCVQDGTQAMRQSSHPVAQALVEGLGKPLVATSANRSGEGAVYTVQDFVSQMEGQDVLPDMVLDAGEIPKRAPSTIVRMQNGEVEVVRQGEVKL